jgi:hypothetical protein
MPQKTDPYRYDYFACEGTKAGTVDFVQHIVLFLQVQLQSIILASEAATCTARKEHERRTSTPSAGFKPSFLTIKRFQIYALYGAATGICLIAFWFIKTLIYYIWVINYEYTRIWKRVGCGLLKVLTVFHLKKPVDTAEEAVYIDGKPAGIRNGPFTK